MMNGKKNGVQKEGVCHVHTYMRTFVLISIFTYYESFLKCSMMYTVYTVYFCPLYYCIYVHPLLSLSILDDHQVLHVWMEYGICMYAYVLLLKDCNSTGCDSHNVCTILS